MAAQQTDIKGSYDALGSFLHQPTLRQLNSGGHDWRKLGSRCDELVVKLDAVLASPVFNINFGTFTTFNCMNEDCAKTVRKRLPRGQTEVPAVCFECGAEHVLSMHMHMQCKGQAPDLDVVRLFYRHQHTAVFCFDEALATALKDYYDAAFKLADFSRVNPGMQRLPKEESSCHERVKATSQPLLEKLKKAVPVK